MRNRLSYPASGRPDSGALLSAYGKDHHSQMRHCHSRLWDTTGRQDSSTEELPGRPSCNTSCRERLYSSLLHLQPAGRGLHRCERMAEGSRAHASAAGDRIAFDVCVSRF